ncbi:MAG: Flp pilus assembly complex ATPase component TadA, partial [Planctomycetes bacterium]|nr:Flp pilus assembly complex ATPase component TadA [Planctomycetota bacterium]
MEIHKLFRMMAKHNASDLHIKIDQPPIFRVNGSLSRMQNAPALDEENTKSLLQSIIPEKDISKLEERGNIDFAYYLEDAGRFRCNIFRQCGSLSAAIRRVTAEIPSYEDLHLPKTVAKCATYHSGLVLVGGITGAGKSSTLAAILDDINHKRRCHILTIEDPIEYLFKEDKSIINQREIGID